jgi:hypothetical protein
VRKAGVKPEAPLHGIVDATPAWVARRLHALSATLLLPCPVRDAFLFPANQGFYSLCTTSVVTLQRAARRIVEHLGLACDTVVVGFRNDLPSPARIEREGGRWFIEIAAAYEKDGPALGAILAHECCHILLDERKIPRFGTAVDEVHVDLGLMLAGLGALTLNAIEDRTVASGGQSVYSHRSFGYLRAPLLRAAYAHVAASLGIDRKSALRCLRGDAARLAVGARMLASIRARRLVYRPMEPHVIVPCSSATCLRRLRIPTGAIGKARCPDCGASERFDGRSYAIQPELLPAAMTEAPLPGDGLWERAYRGFVNWPLRAQLSLAVLVLIFGGLGALSLVGHVLREPLGGPCAKDSECRSYRCLHLIQRDPPLSQAPGLDPWTRKILEPIDARPDPLAPDYPGPRIVEPNGGACTRDCVTDEDCPGGFACSEAVGFTGQGLNGTLLWGDRVTFRVCVKR